jgi:hypothetical protein
MLKACCGNNVIFSDFSDFTYLPMSLPAALNRSVIDKMLLQ